VAAIVGERDRLDEWKAQVRSTRDTGRDLRDLDCMREARAEVVIFGRDEHLALAREPSPRP
jgi:hypothetical protein